MLSSALMIRFAPLLATLALIFSCCYLYDIPIPTPTPAPTAVPVCTMHFTKPANGAVLQADSQVDFAWTSVSKATLYIFSESGPGANGSKSNYPTKNTSWPLELSALGGPGNYTAAVQARDSDSNILCQAQLQFSIWSPSPSPTVTQTLTPTPVPTNTKAPKKHIPPPQATPTATSAPTKVPTKIPTKIPPTATLEVPK